MPAATRLASLTALVVLLLGWVGPVLAGPVPKAEPVFGPDGAPAATTDEEPVFGPDGAPAATTDEEPVFGPDGAPAATTDEEPVFGPDEAPAATTDEEPVFGPDDAPAATTDEEPVFGPDGAPAATTDEEPVFGPDEAPAATTDEEPGPEPQQPATPAISEEPVELKEVEVLGTRARVLTPLPGVILEEGQSSTNIQQSTDEEIRESGAVGVTQFLNEELQSITVQDNTGNPFAQDVVFRGFSASPVISTPQGLSVYLDGVRVNEPFGQVINWDLIPLNAIANLALIPGSNPLFGLNTLGGALSLSTKSGFSNDGIEASETLGSWGRHQTQFTAGTHDEHVAGLMAFNYLREDGWRSNSPSAINQAFARTDVQGDWGQLTAQALYADNELFGGGLLPFEDYVDDPAQTYTTPDGAQNGVRHFWLTGRGDITDELSLSALAYHRTSDQATVNGDFWEQWSDAAAGRVEPCDPQDGTTGRFQNGANETGGTGLGIGCLPNGVLSQGFTEQQGHGGSLQFNWVTETNQLVLGATYDSDRTLFNQTEQLGFISADRTVEIDPDRPFQIPQDLAAGGTCAGVAAQATALGGLDALIAFINLNFTEPDRSQLLDIVAGCTTGGGAVPISSILLATDNAIPRNGLTGRSSTAAAFFFDVYTLAPGLNLSVGGRYSHTRVKISTRTARRQALYQFSQDQIEELRSGQCITDDNPGGAFICQTEQHTYQSFNPALGFAWDVREDLNLFANVSRGTRTPSAIELACAPDDPDPENLPPFPYPPGCTIPTALSNDPFLPQVVSTSYEVGGRGSLRQSVDWNLSAYQTDLVDDILFVSVGIANLGVFDTFGRTRRRGVEVGLKGEREGFNWFVNYSHVDATFQTEAAIINLSNSSSRKQQGLSNVFFVEPGDRIPGVPQHSFRAGVGLDVTPRLNLSLQMVGQASSFVRVNENNEHQPGGTDADGTLRNRPYIGRGELESFAVFNFDGSYQFTEQLSAFAQIDNLFDTDYQTAGQLGLNAFSNQGSQFGARDASGFSNNSNDWTHSTFVGPGAPRAIWVGLRYAN
jgi:iron complex outermembrane recepter protein